MSKRNGDKKPKADKGNPAANDRGGDPGLVLVEVRRAVAWEGLIVRPLIEGKRGTAVSALKVTPARAVMPESLAESFGDDYVKILGPAPEGASPGLVAEPAKPAAKG